MKLKKRLITLVLLACIATSFAGCSPAANQNSENNTTKTTVEEGTPTLTLAYNGDLQAGSTDEFVVEAKLSSLPSGVYPSASMSVAFDKDKVEFTGIEPGTIESYSKEVPAWNVDVEASNELGVVNTIYLDSSGGKEAYYKSGFVKDEKDIVLKLKFKLRAEAKTGDAVHFNIDDAVFATVNGDTDNKNLSTFKDTLKNENLKIDIK